MKRSGLGSGLAYVGRYPPTLDDLGGGSGSRALISIYLASSKTYIESEGSGVVKSAVDASSSIHLDNVVSFGCRLVKMSNLTCACGLCNLCASAWRESYKENASLWLVV